ncbi:MAG: hypothetical protein KJZ87_27085, partial [Thermoguttaceae bacterium]|nr:hypothetical protein [Thermoguttaceae bacterium]
MMARFNGSRLLRWQAPQVRCWLAGAVAVAVMVIGPGVNGADPPAIDPLPGPVQKAYAPADGQVVEVTPPPFIWVPAGKDAVYTLQISTSSDFPDETTRSYRGLRRSVLAL